MKVSDIYMKFNELFDILECPLKVYEYTVSENVSYMPLLLFEIFFE